MPAAWPATLPQNPASFSEQRSPNTVSTDPDTGPSKTRKRFTKSKRIATMTFLLTVEQYATFDSFFVNDMQEGAVSMNFVHPFTEVVVEMYVKNQPQYTSDGGLGVNVSMQVEYF